jgi:hypothetical protein
MGTGDTLRQPATGEKGSREGKAAPNKIPVSWAGTIVSAIAVAVAIFIVHQSQAAFEGAPQNAAPHSEASTGDSSDKSAEDKKANRGGKTGRSLIWASWAQVIGTIIAAIAVVVAIFVAHQGQVALKSGDRNAALQSADSQLSAAMSAIGSGDVAARTAGLLLLTDDTLNRVARQSETGENPAEVYNNYTSALHIFGSYINGHGETFLADNRAHASFGRGYGRPSSQIPLDIVYAADQLQALLAKNLQIELTALQPGVHPPIDLANDELYGQFWHGVNFGWATAYLVGVDLRGADLESSQWSGRSNLSYAYLQCSDLRAANFRGADLRFADLNGTNVQDADFRGAKLLGAKITKVYGSAKWSQKPPGITILPESKWHMSSCLQSRLGS